MKISHIFGTAILSGISALLVYSFTYFSIFYSSFFVGNLYKSLIDSSYNINIVDLIKSSMHLGFFYAIFVLIFSFGMIIYSDIERWNNLS